MRVAAVFLLMVVFFNGRCPDGESAGVVAWYLAPDKQSRVQLGDPGGGRSHDEMRFDAKAATSNPPW